jgi:hypothetical protein
MRIAWAIVATFLAEKLKQVSTLVVQIGKCVFVGYD